MTWDQLAISIASLVGTTAVTSYLTDHIQRQLDYRKLRAKLDNFAGLQAVVLFGDTRYRIQSIDRHGLVMQNELQTIFVPIKKALDNVIALPSDNYETPTRSNPAPPAVDNRVAQMMDEMLAQRFSSLLERVKQDFVTELAPTPSTPQDETNGSSSQLNETDRATLRAGQNPRQALPNRRQPPRTSSAAGR